MKKRILCAFLALCLLLPLSHCGALAETYCGSLDAIKAYLYKQTNLLAGEIAFSYDPSLEMILSIQSARNALLYNAGMVYWRCQIDTQRHVMVIREIQYYQGFKIARCSANGTLNLLGSEEATVLGKAQAIVEYAMSNYTSQLQRERYFHDYLCANVTYCRADYQPGEEGFTLYDTAVGALQYGTCECDGYSDAFYLLCSLAGMEVGFQFGRSAERVAANSDETHLWNIIRIGERWYMVDVTWDDLDYADQPWMCTYACFNFGNDMGGNHLWDNDLTLHSIASTGTDFYFYGNPEPGFGGLAQSLDDAVSYAAQQLRNGNSYVHVMAHSDASADAFNSSLSNALSNYPRRVSWQTWASPIDSLTAYSILFLSN
ncbi:MAG: transglutaminase domain-containing protein [Clostridia bacterium]|nr:transglutaminase domain-containing protein [Clostridia bacterium]